MGDNSAQDYQIAITEFQQIEKLKNYFKRVIHKILAKQPLTNLLLNL